MVDQPYEEELAKIDVIRERTGVGYERATEALKQAKGDVVDALVHLEKHEKKQWWAVYSGDLVSKIGELIAAGNVRTVRIKHDDRTILEIPLTAGVAGSTAALILAPYLTLAAFIAGWYTNFRIEVEKRKSSETEVGPQGEGPSVR
jgi:hypothetical protein